MDTGRGRDRCAIVAQGRRALAAGAAAVGPRRRRGKLLRGVALRRAGDRVGRDRVTRYSATGGAVRRAALNLVQARREGEEVVVAVTGRIRPLDRVVGLRVEVRGGAERVRQFRQTDGLLRVLADFVRVDRQVTGTDVGRAAGARAVREDRIPLDVVGTRRLRDHARIEVAVFAEPSAGKGVTEVPKRSGGRDAGREDAEAADLLLERELRLGSWVDRHEVHGAADRIAAEQPLCAGTVGDVDLAQTERRPEREVESTAADAERPDRVSVEQRGGFIAAEAAQV